jgi:hypothetical protein
MDEIGKKKGEEGEKEGKRCWTVSLKSGGAVERLD